MPTRVKTMFPAGDAKQQVWWIYLVGLRDGAVKVGITRTPRARLMNHRQTLDPVWCHLFSPHDGYFRSAEYECKKALAAIGAQRKRTEVFDGVPRDTAIATCRRVIEARRESIRQIEEQSAARLAEEEQEDRLWAEFKVWRLTREAVTPEPAKA